MHRPPSTPFFRDATSPGAWQDRRAHERFLLDTHLERRAPARPAAASVLARRLRALVTRRARA